MGWVRTKMVRSDDGGPEDDVAVFDGQDSGGRTNYVKESSPLPDLDDHPHQDVRTSATPTFEGADMSINKIINVVDPDDDQDVATKKFVVDSGFWSRSGTVVKPKTVGDEVHIENPTQSENFEIKKVDGSALTTFKDTVTSVGGASSALNFDGDAAAERVTMGDVIDMGTNDMDVSFWMKTTSVGFEGLVQKHKTAGQVGRWAIYLDSGKIKALIQTVGSGTDIATSTTSVNDGGWHNVVVSYDRDGNLVIYIDAGAGEGTIAISGGNGEDLNTGNTFGFANLNDSSGTSPLAGRYYEGVLEEVAVWFEVLSSSDRTDLYAGGDGLRVDAGGNWPTDGGSMGDNLQGLWHMDEGTGTSTIADDSGNGYTGTMNNLDEADWVTGKILSEGTAKTNTIFQSRDGISAGESGAIELGANAVRNTLNGKTLRFKILGLERLELDSTGTMIWKADNTGMVFGEINVVSNSTETTITTQNVPVQITIFDSNGHSNATTPDNTNDHITITKAGKYLITCPVTINSVGGSGSTTELEVMKNNGASRVGALHVDRTLVGGGSESGAVTMIGLADLAVDDTIEVWIKNETNTQNYIVEDITLTLTMLGGT